ncbi:hypothetical protein RRG08_064545 [Elysia crispata]|uniref:Transposable element n=1 Tax=Elysia crispata TaxID=231223 RepID=A0AAE1BAR3_9GAST|nr:hypothetical protein RRG08_064545 [Elysia crispata]
MPPFANLSVKLAVQILSHSVAAGITTMVHYGDLPPEAMATAHFVEEFDKLFNCFNSSSRTGKAPMSHAISSSTEHVIILREKLRWLDSIKLLNKSGTLPCIHGWKLTIACHLDFWDDLSNKYNVSFLITNRLNQDCLENMFSVVRGKGGHRINPDCREFRSALTQIMVDAILGPGKGSNCQADLDTFLFTLDNITAKGATHAIRTRLHQDVPRLIQPIVQNCASAYVLEVVEKDVVAYISGYVAKKLTGVVCELCKADLIQESHVTDSSFFLSVKQYRHLQEGGLTMPSPALQHCLQTAEIAFRDAINSLRVSTGVRFRLVKKMVEATKNSSLGCRSGKNCSAKFLSLNLYTTIRLHHFLRCQNREADIGSHQRGRKRKALTFAHV